ncbi:MAG TPA: OmpA family protein [Candidatus Binatia bacterium]|jgi:outer membrane protein OmpA-like peptidoglycan-associated protein|nr:OmpA family protein [Candidatus Binatia bacterium]
MNKTFLMRGIAFLVAVALLSSCSQPLTTREKGTLIGGGIGGAAGAIVGAAVGNPGAGAAIGGALGAGAGALVGDRLQKRDQELSEQQQQIEQQKQEITRNQQLIDDLKKQNLEARETERGVVVNLPDVLFEFGKADLTGDARAKVGNISEVLNNQAQGRRVSIEGHTDSIGSDAYNQKLSERRAENVASTLENGGVSAERVTAKGYGKRYPVAPNSNSDGSDNPAGRAKNRRVEVVIEN